MEERAGTDLRAKSKAGKERCCRHIDLTLTARVSPGFESLTAAAVLCHGTHVITPADADKIEDTTTYIH